MASTRGFFHSVFFLLLLCLHDIFQSLQAAREKEEMKIFTEDSLCLPPTSLSPTVDIFYVSLSLSLFLSSFLLLPFRVLINLPSTNSVRGCTRERVENRYFSPIKSSSGAALGEEGENKIWVFWDVCRLRNGFKFEDILRESISASLLLRSRAKAMFSTIFMESCSALLVAQTWMWKINKNLDFMCPTDLKREIVWENFSSSLLIAVDEFGLRQSLLFILFVQITALLRVEIMILSSLCWFNATSWTWIYVHTIEPADQLDFSARAEQAINYLL